jgi:hypothetical protein
LSSGIAKWPKNNPMASNGTANSLKFITDLILPAALKRNVTTGIEISQMPKSNKKDGRFSAVA